MKNPQSRRVPDARATQTWKGKLEVSVNCDDVQCACGICKRKRLMDEFFPQELIFNILLRLPAQVIYDVIGRVCKEWKYMIHTHNFVYENLKHSTSGLLIQMYLSEVKTSYFVGMGKEGLEISKVNYLSRRGVWSSCNGLVLTTESNFLRVINPVTKQQIPIPPLDRQTQYFQRHGCGLAYVTASMEYKVIQFYNNGNGDVESQFAILTIGVDKAWRNLNTEQFSLDTALGRRCVSLVTGGFMHWIGDSLVLTLNVETETVHVVHIPNGTKTDDEFLAMGSNLSLVRKCNNFLWEVWEMKSETGEWTKLSGIDFEAQRCTLEHLFSTDMPNLRPDMHFLHPFGWLNSGEVLVFCVFFFNSIMLIARNVRTQEIHSFNLKAGLCSENPVVHINSLVWVC